MQVTGKHLCWSYFLIKLQACRFAILLKETPTQVFSCEYFEEYLQTAASVVLIIKFVISIGHLFLIKNMKWDRVYWDMVRVYSLLIISRNHFNTFLLLQLQWNYFMSILICANKQVAKFLTIPFLKNNSPRLLLKISFLKIFFCFFG